MESGFTLERAGRDADLTRTFTWPQLELHAGLGRRLEGSLAWDGLVSTTMPKSESNLEERSTGWADLRVGAKVGLVSGPSIDAALIGYAELLVATEPAPDDRAPISAR